jgi:hypothetical protein
MNSSLKEKALMAVLVMVVLYAGAAASWFFYAESAWKKSARQYNKSKDTYRKECQLISERGKWATSYEEEKANMPMFEAGKATDTTWLKKMDDMALKHRIQISQRQSGKEVDAGEVLELPLEVKSWEGSLEALVKFMHELENTDEGMFDIKTLNFRPSSKGGYLRGSFTLTCAYMRE